MRLGRRRKNYAPIVIILLVAVGVFALVYYIMGSSLRNSPVYVTNKVLYIVKDNENYAFILVNSDDESVKVVYTVENLYDPESGKTLNSDPVENYSFFKDVFGVSTTQWRFVDLSGDELGQFAKVLLGKRVNSLGDLLRSLKRRRGFFDIFLVGKVTKSMSNSSNLDNSALLKLLDSLRKYDLDERTIKGITAKPVTVKIEGEGEYKRMYIDAREKTSVREFLGAKE
jgi:hypothetical protein